MSTVRFETADDIAERERCPVCDAPLAGEADYDEWDTLWCAKASAAMFGEERPDIDLENWRPELCWSAGGCQRPPVDWRARALAAEKEVARLRARVRVETGDVERAGVTRTHVEAWLGANGWEPSPREGGSFGSFGRFQLWRRIQRDERGVPVYVRDSVDTTLDSVESCAHHAKRPGLDILDEMAAMQTELSKP